MTMLQGGTRPRLRSGDLTSATLGRSFAPQTALLYTLNSAVRGRGKTNAWSARPLLFFVMLTAACGYRTGGDSVQKFWP